MSSRRLNPDQPPPGHSAIEAHQAAIELADAGIERLSVFALDLQQLFDMMKLTITATAAGEEHRIDVECSARDASLILATLGVTGDDDITGLVGAFHATGLPSHEAMETARLIMEQPA